MLRRSRDACSRVAKRLYVEKVRLGGCRVVASKKSKDRVSHVLRGFVLSMKNGVKKHIVHARASFTQRSSMFVEILRTVEVELHYISSSQSVYGDGALDVTRATASRDVRSLTCIDAMPDADSFAKLTSDKAQAASSSLFKNGSKTTPKRPTKSCKTLTMQTRSDAAEVSSNYMLVIDLESDPE